MCLRYRVNATSSEGNAYTVREENGKADSYRRNIGTRRREACVHGALGPWGRDALDVNGGLAHDEHQKKSSHNFKCCSRTVADCGSLCALHII